MQPVIDDVSRTLEYGHSHEQAQRLMPFTLGAIALGLFLTVPFDGRSTAENAALGWLVVAGAVAFLGVIIYRRTQPSVPYIVVSERGVLFKLVTDRIMPWNEIRAVDRASVRYSGELLSTKVVRLALSQTFYEALTGGKLLDSATGKKGDPSYVYLSHAVHVPHDELYAAIRRRWIAFSRHAEGVTADDETIAQTGVGAAALPVSRRIGAIQRVQSFEGVGALARLLAGGSIGQTLGNVAALAVIAALVTNQIGIWSTAAQDRGRANAAEWAARNAKWEQDQRALDADVKRTRDMWDRKFKCMDEYWDSHAKGTYKGDPACMKEN